MSSNLRPDMEIEQIVEAADVIVQDAENPLVIIGVNRQAVWRENTGDFVGGQAGNPYFFPNLFSGAKVEQPSAAEEVLRPHVFLSNRFGVTEVSPTYDFVSYPPSFTLSPSLSAVFDISEGTTGEYTASSMKFTDDNADFIEDEVAAYDKILIDDVESFNIGGIVSDTELDVIRIDKGPNLLSGNLSIGDGNDDRTFTDSNNYDFVAAGVAVGDIVEVDFWDIISRANGIDYSAEVGGVRTVTGDIYDFAASGVQPPIIGPPYETDIIWIKDTNGDWVPTFKVTGNVQTTTLEAVNLITVPAWPIATAAGEDDLFEIFHYAEIDLDPPNGVYTDATGAYTAEGTPGPGQRNFTCTTAAIDFTVILTLPLTQYHVVVHGINDAGGTDKARPIFKIIAVTDATTLVVENWDPDRPMPAGTGAGVTWEIWNDGGAPVLSFLGADITAEGGGGAPPGQRCLTSTYNDFSVLTGEGVAIGDIVYDLTGAALFTVTGDTLVTGNDNKIYVENLIPGNPASVWSDAEFGFYIGDQKPASLRVMHVIDKNSLRVRNVLTDPPLGNAWTNLYYTITVADVLSNIDYTIEKTVTGANLSGDVLVSYMARRNDSYSAVFPVEKGTWESLLGHGIPANPLGLGAKIATLNSNFPVYCLQIPEDVSQDWLDALNYIKTDKLYNVCPLTQMETVLSAYRAHVLEQSEPAVKRDRIMFQSHDFERVETRTTGATSTFSKTAITTVVTIIGDVSAYGAVVGDVMEGIADVAGTKYDFEARIISMVTGVTSVLTVVNDNGIGGVPPVNGTIDEWTIKSKDLTDLEYAQKIAAYANGISERRIRNVWPDECQVQFSDQTDPSSISGFYGGGDVVQLVGGHFQAATFAAMRSSQKPSQALTKIAGTGIYRVLNPFGDFWGGNDNLNDVVLNGGNWIATQSEVGGDISTARAVTTDTSNVKMLEDSFTYQIDNFARMLRKQVRPFLGPFNIEGPFFDMVSTNVQAVITKVVDTDKDMKSIEFLSIEEVEDLLDTFALEFDADPFISAARCKVKIFV